MALTCLQLVQQVAARLAIASPNAVVTATDPQILQLLAFCNEEGQALVARHEWTALQNEATFTTLAAQLQGLVETFAPGYKFILNETIWNRTTRLPILGSKSPQEWQRAVSMNFTSPYSQYRVKGGSVYFFPIPTAGHTCAFEYSTRNWVNKAAGGTASLWSADGDTCVFDDDIMMKGTLWRWKAEKGLDYAEDFAMYEALVTEAINRDGSKPVLSSHGTPYEIEPLVVIPTGSWMS